VSVLPRVSPAPPSDPPSRTEPDLVARERAALREVLRLVADRAGAEARVEADRAAGDAAADQEFLKARRSLAGRVEGIAEVDRAADAQRRREVVDTAIAREAEAKSEFARASRKIASEFDATREKAKAEFARDRSDAAAGFDAGERSAAAAYAAARKPVDDAARIRNSMRARLDAVYADYRAFGLADPPATPARETRRSDDPVDALFDRLARAEKPLALLEGLVIPKAMKGYRFVWVIVALFPVLAYPLALIEGVPLGLGLAAAGAVVLGLLVRHGLTRVARDQVSRLFDPLYQTVVDAEALGAQCLARVEQTLKDARAAAAARRDTELNAAKRKHAATLSAGEDLRDERLRRINEVYAARMVEIQTAQTLGMRGAVEHYERRRAELLASQEARARRLDEAYQAAKQAVRDRHEADWAALEADWRGGMGRARDELDGVARAVDEAGPAWADPAWADLAPPRRVPPAVRFGEVRVDLARLPDGVPADPRLRDGVPDAFTFPALLTFPDRANLFIEAPAEGRAAATGLLQAAMFRLLTGLPPGHVRFTIIDPLGIGRNFGAFMHLADYDEALVTGQVWTDPRQIEERLADLAAHMEKVTQRYLRDEYATIDEYNAVAGEVAEPYRVLVVADFPAGFDEKAAGRLAGIAAGGPPCGVLTLIAADPSRPLPTGFRLDDFGPGAVRLRWDGERLAWSDPDFGPFPLALDPPPPADLATRLTHRAGAAARDAKRVEVPFAFIAPPEDAWWSGDARGGIDIALGKSGATKRQDLTLGQGTSQHVLIAGRTGSGKSTLLHALITNLALTYSPDEVDLYLIDFKKGVEFKVYATHALPHASVVAIESEREFGVSVLQRLDAEMGRRADRFRDAGVQDLAGYRNAPGTPPMPRCLLIIDEFQEFFVEDDKVAQEAALLLDRLVRQGRAFGVHVLLGSQTLGGAYALARSTLGQMAVRVALQCSEADAPLILSEQNPAARMLSRPGEAVYNDANGMPEGNHFFQVVWLPDDRREAYLNRIAALARDRPPALARTPIVFEGDAPADLARNSALAARLDAPAWPASPRSAAAWLGDPVAIHDPTAAVFRRQGASHLLVVGQNEESALGVVASALLSLAAQYPPPGSDTERSGAAFHVLDGTPEDHPRAGYLARVAGVLPHPASVGGWRDVPRVVAAVAAEVKRRQQPDADGPEVFLLIHDLPRLRDLRREDDFAFNRRDGDDATPSDNLTTVLTEGPGLGVHVLTWCDNLNNLNRVFGHQTLREFGMRVLFQMSATDSGHLLDAPHAGKLGPHRALFLSEDQNRLEKFRPYGPPADDLLDRVGDRFRTRAETDSQSPPGV